MTPDTKTKLMYLLSLCTEKSVDFVYSPSRVEIMKFNNEFPSELIWRKVIDINLAKSDEDYLSLDEAVDFLIKL